tara:strand:- start:84 stop:353 length:270 start_codon:yes stop_codon:yes gene_type:complete
MLDNNNMAFRFIVKRSLYSVPGYNCFSTQIKNLEKTISIKDKKILELEQGHIINRNTITVLRNENTNLIKKLDNMHEGIQKIMNSFTSL